MDMERVNAIKQRHLATKQRIIADEAAKAKARRYADDIESICDYILDHLDSDKAYDRKGMDGEYYRNTAWVEVKHTMARFNGVTKACLDLLIPRGSSCISSFDYSEEEFMQLLCDVFEKFRQLEGFEIIDHRIVMLLEE